MTVRIDHLRTRSASRWLRLDVRRFLPSFVVGGYGIFILSLFLRHVMTWYINPNYVWPTVLAGAVLIGLAWPGIEGTSAACSDESCCATDDCGCESSPRRLWTYGFLAVPLVLAVIFPPRSLAAFSATQRGPQIAGLTAFHSGTTFHRVSLSVDTRTFTLQDWVGALSSDPNPKDYLGKPIVLEGLVLHAPASVPPGYIMVLRYQITCCIADARPEGLVVKDTSHGALQDNQWVRVTGVMGQTSYQQQSLAIVLPKQVQRIKAGDPYMY